MAGSFSIFLKRRRCSARLMWSQNFTITVPASASDLNELDVEVKLVDDLSAGATVVPVSALVARGDGTFEVEALTTTGTTFVPVVPGMFSDGVVAVEGIAPGTQVVVP